MRLTAGGPTPLYYQLEQDLRDRIRAGEFSSGAPLPTEQRLCATYGVSRITVRRALDSLLASGLIARRQGVGTFVNGQGESVKTLKLIGSLEDMTAHGADLTYRVLARETEAATPGVAEALGLPVGTTVVRVEAVFWLRGDPFAHAEIFSPPEVGEVIGDSGEPGAASLVARVERALGRPIERADQTVEAAPADGRIAKHLGLRPRAPVLEVNRTYYTDADRPVVAAVVRYHPGRYRYTVQLFANARAAHRARP